MDISTSQLLMKVLYNGVCKRLPPCKTYDELVGQLQSRFSLSGTAQIGENLKLFYLDEDGDIICVSCDDDLQEAMQILPDGRIKMALSNSSDNATAVLNGAPDNSSNDAFRAEIEECVDAKLETFRNDFTAQLN